VGVVDEDGTDKTAEQDKSDQRAARRLYVYMYTVMYIIHTLRMNE